jgi:Fe-S-cluster containining protein
VGDGDQFARMVRMNDQLAAEVRNASRRPEVVAAVREVYERLQGEVDARKPLCVQSGKCCRFDEYGHRLYVTTIELAAFVSQLLPIADCQLPIESVSNRRSLPLAVSPGGCPFQIDKMCGVHTIRPFGCRIFYCDLTAAQWQQDKYEQFHSELKALHETFGIPYFYVEWRQALGVLGIIK